MTILAGCVTSLPEMCNLHTDLGLSCNLRL